MLYSSEKNEISMVLSGDAMITRPLSMFDEPHFLALSYLFKKSDVGFTNLEMLMHDYGISPGIPGGVFAASDPKNLKESIGLLNFLGFDDLARETSVYLLANKVVK